MGDSLIKLWRFGILKSDLKRLRNTRMRNWVIKSYALGRMDKHGEWIAIHGTVFLWLSKPKVVE